VLQAKKEGNRYLARRPPLIWIKEEDRALGQIAERSEPVPNSPPRPFGAGDQ